MSDDLPSGGGGHMRRPRACAGRFRARSRTGAADPDPGGGAGTHEKRRGDRDDRGGGARPRALPLGRGRVLPHVGSLVRRLRRNALRELGGAEPGRRRGSTGPRGSTTCARRCTRDTGSGNGSSSTPRSKSSTPTRSSWSSPISTGASTTPSGCGRGWSLIPVGLVNEFHEPTVFLGAERAVTEQRIIPTTWRANGAGFYGSRGRLAYRAYVVNALDGSGFSSAGLRGGRQKGSKAKASGMAVTGRVDVTLTPGIFVGASAYTGGSGHGEVRVDGDQVDATVDGLRSARPGPRPRIRPAGPVRPRVGRRCRAAEPRPGT